MKELEDMQNYELFMVIIAGIQILRENERKQGYEDGKADTPFTDTEEAEKKAYERGLNDAWDAAKRANEINTNLYDKLFPMTFMEGLYESYSAKEVIEKFAEYDNKQKQDAEIKVGDEVYSDAFDDKGIITHITADKVSCVCIICNGWTMMKVGTNGLHRTGRTFPQIAEVLKQMNREEDK